jgi:hypothetical protein
VCVHRRVCLCTHLLLHICTLLAHHFHMHITHIHTCTKSSRPIEIYIIFQYNIYLIYISGKSTVGQRQCVNIARNRPLSREPEAAGPPLVFPIPNNHVPSSRIAPCPGTFGETAPFFSLIFQAQPLGLGLT